ncbi:hypothetical protein Btru_025773 [Bulinus truncatus]|nr:hypothetical protein Btru_025773 [Bulinus truncatus]
MDCQVDSVNETVNFNEVIEDNGDKSVSSEVSADIKTSGDKKFTVIKDTGDIKKEEVKIRKALTPQEIEEKRKEIMEKCVQKLICMQKTPIKETNADNAQFSHDFRKFIHYIALVYFCFKEGQVPYRVITEHRETVGRALVEHDTVTIMCDALSDALITDDYSMEDGKMLPSRWFPVKNTILSLLNYSDCNDSIKQIVTDHSRLLPLILKFLSDKSQKYIQKELNEDFEKMCKWLLSIVHNCGALKENVPRLRELNVIKTVLPYLESQIETHRLTVIAILADLVNEEEAELLGAHVSVFKFLLKTLENALMAESHKNLGWSVQELTRAVKQLARNDANKEILVHEGCLPLIIKILDDGSIVEIYEAVHCLWALSFNVENTKRMVEEPLLVEKVYKGYQITDGSLKHAFHGVLWSLRDELIKSDHYKNIGEEIINLKTTSVPIASSTQSNIGGCSKGHVMISYQWADQEMIKQICEELRANGVPVWIDIDYMCGSTLQAICVIVFFLCCLEGEEAMAQAVEDATIVIIAMSQLYKDSPNTRAEAEYAFRCHKKIIPLMMQKNYKPDGWLGLILGSKLYYDFSGKYPDFNKPMTGLLKALISSVSSDDVDSEPLITPSQSIGLEIQQKPGTYHSKAIEKVKGWTKSEITKWLTKHHLHLSELQNLTNEEIIFLYNLKHEAAEFFYHCLETKLNLVTLQNLARAAQAFEDMTV